MEQGEVPYDEPNINNNQSQDITGGIKNNININNQNNYPENKLENQENEIDQEQMNQNEEELENQEIQGDEEEGEDDLPLVTLKFISICQCCPFAFDNNEHLPFLLKCGHFFCSKCLQENFTDNEGIKCPIDGLVAQSMKDLKLLNNLITDKNVQNKRSNNKQIQIKWN